MDEGGSESGGPASLSTKQLVYIAADIQKLEEQVHSHNKYIFCCAHYMYLVNISLNYALVKCPYWEFKNNLLGFF